MAKVRGSDMSPHGSNMTLGFGSDMGKPSLSRTGTKVPKGIIGKTLFGKKYPMRLKCIGADCGR